MAFAWDDLQLFLAIARSGSLAGAARRLQVNHSTVFRRLNALETTLQARLFERLAQGYVLTPAGEALRVRAERVEEETQAIERELSGQDVRLSGRLRVTTTDTLANTLLAPVFADFSVRHPGIELELLVLGTFLDLTRREADVAIRPTATPPPALIGRKLGVIRWGVYGSAAYLAEHPAYTGTTDPGQRYIGGNALIAHLESTRWLEQRVAPEAIAVRSNSVLAALQLARAGAGLAVLPHYMARTCPELVCVERIEDGVATDLWLLVHPDLRHSGRVRAFMDHCGQALQPQRHALEGLAGAAD